MTKEPIYLVQSADQVLHGYWSPIMLLCDLARNRGEDVKLFKASSPLGKVKYAPCTEAAIQEDKRIAELNYSAELTSPPIETI